MPILKDPTDIKNRFSRSAKIHALLRPLIDNTVIIDLDRPEPKPPKKPEVNVLSGADFHNPYMMINLLGAPPGIVGHGMKPVLEQLTEEGKPVRIVEFDKMHPALRDIFGETDANGQFKFKEEVKLTNGRSVPLAKFTLG